VFKYVLPAAGNRTRDTHWKQKQQRLWKAALEEDEEAWLTPVQPLPQHAEPS